MQKNVKPKKSTNLFSRISREKETDLPNRHVKEEIQIQPPNEIPINQTPPRRRNWHTSREPSPERSYSPPTIPASQIHDQVEWTWQSPVDRKSSDKSRSGPSTKSLTPKRAAHLQKNKISSPLMYLPEKAPLIKPEVFENIDKLAAHWKSLPNRPVAENSTNNNHETKNEDKKYKEKIAINQQLKTESEKKPLIPIKNVSSQVTEKTDCIEEQNSLEDLFDDCSDDALILCSQQVEEAYMSNGVKKCADNSGNSANVKNAKSQGENSKTSEPSARRRSTSPVNIPVNVAQTKKSKQSLNNNKLKNELEEDIHFLTIPDDLINEFFSNVVDEVEHTPELTKIPMTNEPTFCRFGRNTSFERTYQGPKKKTIPSTRTDFVKTNQASEKQINSNIHTVTNVSIVSTSNVNNNQERRFFKHRNYSDTSTSSNNVSNQEKKFLKSKVHSNLNLRPNSSSISCASRPEFEKRTVSNELSLKTVSSTLSTGIINRYSTEEERRNNSQRQQIYTAEEIERKRLDAVMKREAKKRQGSNSF